MLLPPDTYKNITSFLNNSKLFDQVSICLGHFFSSSTTLKIYSKSTIPSLISIGWITLQIQYFNGLMGLSILRVNKLIFLG